MASGDKRPEGQKDQRAEGSASHTRLLILLVVYVTYLPYFFVPVTEIPSGGLQGPVHGWEQLLLSLLFIFLGGSVLDFGFVISDVAFLIGSVCFADGHSRAARTAAIVAMLLSLPLLVSSPRLGLAFRLSR